MSLDFISFYNIVGDEVSVPNLVDQFIDYYQQKREVGETQITDFNEGSEIRNILEVFAVGIFALLEDVNETGKLPFISHSYGTWLDRIGENPFINLPRIQGAEANGTVTFTLAEAQESDFIIPAGTLLIDENTGILFDTDTECTIPIGETSADCQVTCLSTGAIGNSGSGDISIISSTDLNLEILSVSNSDAFDNGVDEEDDELYRVRLLNNIRAEGFGSQGYYTQMALDVPNVHDVVFVSDEDYTRNIIVNGFDKPVPDSVLLDVLAEFSDSDNVVLGHSFSVDSVSYKTVDLTVSLDVTSALADATKYTTNLKAFVDGLDGDMGLDYVGLMIGEALTNDMIDQAFSTFDNVLTVTSVSATVNSSSVVFPVSVDGDEVIKIGSVTVTENIVN